MDNKEVTRFSRRTHSPESCRGHDGRRFTDQFGNRRKSEHLGGWVTLSYYGRVAKWLLGGANFSSFFLRLITLFFASMCSLKYSSQRRIGSIKRHRKYSMKTLLSTIHYSIFIFAQKQITSNAQFASFGLYRLICCSSHCPHA